MATTINQYSVGLTLNAKDYIDASKLSATETRKLTADINAARSPAEKYSQEHDRLKAALDKGAISEATYNRLIDAKKQKLEAANPKLEKHVDLLGQMSKVGNIVTGTYHAIRGAIEVAMGPVRLVQDMWQEFDKLALSIDETQKAAVKLGLSFSQFSSMRFAAAEIGGDAGALEDAMLQMMRRGFGGTDPLASFLEIADEIEGMANQSERVQRAFEVFGRRGTDVLGFLQAGTETIRESVEFAQRWNSLTDAQAMAVEQYNDSWGRVQTIVDGVANTMVAEMAPVLTLVSEDIIAFAEAATRSDNVMRSMADHLAIQYGIWKEIMKAAQVVALFVAMQPEEAGRLAATMNNLGDAGIAELLRLHAKRKELEDAADEAAQKRDQQRIDAVGQQQDAHIRLFEEYKKQQEQLARQALDNAKKHFEQERKMQMQMRLDVGKGPGSGMEVGSAEAARFMADQTNAAISVEAVPDLPTPGENELIAEAQKQLKIMEEQAAQNKEQIALLQKLVNKPPELARAR